MIKNISIITLVYTLIASGLSYYYLSGSFALSVFVGGTMMLLNLEAISFFWNLIFYKKSIALAVFVIIFKYVILGIILLGLSTSGWLNAIGFLIGLTSLVFSILAAMLVKSFSFQKK